MEHRHGAQRIPLLIGIGASRCVNDITRAELGGAVRELFDVHGLPVPAGALEGADGNGEEGATATGEGTSSS